MHNAIHARQREEEGGCAHPRAPLVRLSNFPHLELPMRRLQQLLRLLPGTARGQHKLIDHHLLPKCVHFSRVDHVPDDDTKGGRERERERETGGKYLYVDRDGERMKGTDGRTYE